jgi:hypothetical protein
MSFEANDIVRLLAPDSVEKTGRPEHLLIRKNGQEYRLRWGQDFRVSARCDPDNRVASLDYGGAYPLIHIDVVKEFSSQFQLIKREESS